MRDNIRGERIKATSNYPFFPEIVISELNFSFIAHGTCPLMYFLADIDGRFCTL